MASDSGASLCQTRSPRWTRKLLKSLRSSSDRLARATLVSFISVLREVAAAPLPSLMLRTPLRAACTIWSCVRERLSMNRSQKTTVASYTASATL